MPFIAIDLKSFYASVECVERSLDPLDVNLVVADESRTDKTICLAVSPALKSFGVPGRPRLFEVRESVRKLNLTRKKNNKGGKFAGSSCSIKELSSRPDFFLDFVIAPPRMALYEKYSSKIYSIYLKFVAPEDMHVYSVDEVFKDVGPYLKLYNMTPYEMTVAMIREVLKATGITATAGIGTNLYLCKVAMDIVAKHVLPNKDGVRIAELDELSYRQLLWNHLPLTDFWRIGKGTASRLEAAHLKTMGDLARYSLSNEDRLFEIFGINAELLIDHAWGYEPCSMKDIHSYHTTADKSISSSQVLPRPYKYDEALTIIREMAEAIVMDLLQRQFEALRAVLYLDYDSENVSKAEASRSFGLKTVANYYGKLVPEPLRCTHNFGNHTSVASTVIKAFTDLYEKRSNKNFTVRRISLCLSGLREVSANSLSLDAGADSLSDYQNASLFEDYKEVLQKRKKEMVVLEKEHALQEARLEITSKFGKNSLLKAMNLKKEATARVRNAQIGGHKA